MSVVSTLLAKNVGSIDRVLRIVLGIALLALAFTGPKTAWGYFGFIPLLTGLFGTCPFYSLFGFNTCGVRRT